MSVPVLSRLLVVCREGPPKGPKLWPSTGERSTVRLRPSDRLRGRKVGLHQPTSCQPASDRSPTDPALRANPFPEVTDPFCRLPLPTLFYQLEAVHLGDLMRLSVRPGARISRSLGFHGPSRAHRTPPQVWCFTGHSTLSPANLIPGCQSVKKKRELFPGLPPTSPSSLASPLRAQRPSPHPGSGMLTRFPFGERRGRRSDCAFQRDLSLPLGSTNPCPTAVHMEPFSTSVFKVLV